MKYLILLILIGCTQTGPKGDTGLSGNDGIDGKDGYSCTTEDIPEGALVTCEDGSESIIEDGDDLTPTPTPLPSPSPGTCIILKHKGKKKTICFIVK